jgi:hypothetical protein
MTGYRAFVAGLGLLALGSGCAGPSTRPSYSNPPGLRVLSVARAMVDRREILPGSCWDYIDAVYTRAGYPEDKRRFVYKTVKKGPYAEPKLILAGDWLYFVNHAYGGIEHSALFVEWTNRGARQARMLSYGGEKRREPGRYLEYALTNVYAIIRPQP